MHSYSIYSFTIVQEEMFKYILSFPQMPQKTGGMEKLKRATGSSVEK